MQNFKRYYSRLLLLLIILTCSKGMVAQSMLEKISPRNTNTVFELTLDKDYSAWTKHGKLSPYPNSKRPKIKQDTRGSYIEFTGGEELCFPANGIFPVKGTFETVIQRMPQTKDKQDKHHFFTLFNDDKHRFWLRLHGIKDFKISPSMKNGNNQFLEYIEMPVALKDKDEWRHIALQWDFSDLAKSSFQLFIDGKLVADEMRNISGIKVKQSSRLYIGSWLNPTGKYAAFTMKPYRLGGMRINEGHITDSDKIAAVYNQISIKQLKRRFTQFKILLNTAKLNDTEKKSSIQIITEINRSIKDGSITGDRCKEFENSINILEQKAAFNSWLEKYSPYSLMPQNDKFKMFWCDSLVKVKSKVACAKPKKKKK